MTSIQEKIDFLGSRIWTTRTWLEDFGRHSKNKRGDLEIDQKERNLKLYEAIQTDYVTAQQRRAG